METEGQPRRITGKSKNELLKTIASERPGGESHEQIKMAIFVQCTEDLEKVVNNATSAIKDFTKSNNRLSIQILVLNVIFRIFTVVGTVFTVWQIFK
jgi:hypothetical protein